jgi:hypothetical protein
MCLQLLSDKLNILLHALLFQEDEAPTGSRIPVPDIEGEFETQTESDRVRLSSRLKLRLNQAARRYDDRDWYCVGEVGTGGGWSGYKRSDRSTVVTVSYPACLCFSFLLLFHLKLCALPARTLPKLDHSPQRLDNSRPGFLQKRKSWRLKGFGIIQGRAIWLLPSPSPSPSFSLYFSYNNTLWGALHSFILIMHTSMHRHTDTLMNFLSCMCTPMNIICNSQTTTSNTASKPATNTMPSCSSATG